MARPISKCDGQSNAEAVSTEYRDGIAYVHELQTTNKGLKAIDKNLRKYRQEANEKDSERKERLEIHSPQSQVIPEEEKEYNSHKPPQRASASHFHSATASDLLLCMLLCMLAHLLIPHPHSRRHRHRFGYCGCQLQLVRLLALALALAFIFSCRFACILASCSCSCPCSSA